MLSRMSYLRSASLVVASLLVASNVFAQDTGYRLPPREIVDIHDAPNPPSVDFSSDARAMLLVERPVMPSIEDIVRPWVGLAGTRVDTQLRTERQTVFITGLSLASPPGSEPQRIDLPKGARIGEVRWSHNSRRFAFTLATESGMELWTATIDDAKPVRVARNLCGVLGDAFEFLPDGDNMIVKVLPKGLEAPRAPDVPRGPAIQETAGKSTPIRTYQDLLSDPYSEELFAYYATAEVVRFDVETGKTTRVGPPALYASVESSPDGEHLLVTRLERPFSYVLPAMLFPQTIEVWTSGGKLEKKIADVPMGETIPMEGVRTEPRNVHWQASARATLVWAEALDGGDPKKKAEWRDRWMSLAAPFTGEAKELLRLAQRARGLQWMQSPSEVLASEYDRDRRWTKTALYDLDAPTTAPKVIDDRSANERYADPGSPVTRLSAWGTRVVRRDGVSIYRAGRGDSPTGARPFLDRYDLRAGTSERLWQCAPNVYESFVAMSASGANTKPTILTSYESPTEPPNYRERNLQSDSVTSLTDFPDPTPQIRGVHKELVTYTRKDGVKLSATLYLPKGYTKGQQLPLVVWAYPMEFNDADTAGQIGGSPFRFVRLRGPSHLLFLTQGYAIMDDATMPVVGDPETMNDTFLDQVVSSAQAAIDKAVEMGVADRTRVGVGGHSYGAFMTANLLAHCDLFSAGIARSGAYNRTLTPFGFQSERRTLWEAPDVYWKLSPFLAAEKINEPMLMIHGEKDSNQGTFPIQSERMYQAIKGNGGTARLVILPGESHGYQARESVLHTVAEMVDWFERHVKRPSSGGGAPIAGAERDG
jgi:dipeptidyl aminopeptidase/acylaminoacyl peptidase